jgi:hypothetical protein
MAYVDPAIVSDITKITANPALTRTTFFKTRLAVRTATMQISPAVGDIDRNLVYNSGQATAILPAAQALSTV